MSRLNGALVHSIVAVSVSQAIRTLPCWIGDSGVNSCPAKQSACFDCHYMYGLMHALNVYRLCFPQCYCFGATCLKNNNKTKTATINPN